ncbi:MarR family winged helix-turn-helix transcriptional regulator [Dehalobacterium formicoaceticum]|uniref:MarR family transcriptional regulator n=1 Tax=Dehalobacterium formicoaceticum TaxID=51515 RepID=A0ABT1Y6R3_9FIRM|nr:MarR family transcriptional regulator [Dehalobacterium formicoaceticum]MCR6546583.1 MarR family transcriptional regulator [Dehalobacterium formicoaceticum]
MNRNPIGLELHALENLIMRKIANSEDKKQIDPVTSTNGWIIGFLANNADKDIYQKDLEEQFTITRSTVSKVLILMEKKGLIERQSVPHDSRLKKLTLTDKAWKLSKLMKEKGDKLEEALTRGFTEEESEALYSYIQRMKDNIK